MMTKSVDKAPENARKRTGFARLLQFTTALGFIGLMAGGVAALHMRANAEVPPAANPPVTVEASRISFSDGYSIVERFAGRMEPLRETRLAFERGGLVTEILFDEGDEVAAGAVVARLDTDKLRAERDGLLAQRKELLARQALAKATLKRQRQLNSKGWRSAQNYDEARFSFEEIAAAITRVDAAIASIDVDISK